MADDDRDSSDPFADPPERDHRAHARALGYRTSEVIVRVFEVDVELTLPSGSIHAGVVMLIRDRDGYRTLGEIPEHWIDRALLVPMLQLGRLDFERACMALWLAALDVVPV